MTWSLLITLVTFFLSCAATWRSSRVFDRAEANGAMKKDLNRLANFGGIYAVIMIVSAFALVGTIETM